MNEELEELKLKLQGSFLYFINAFFPLVTGRDFSISSPIGRESHHVTVSRELTSIFRGKESRLLLNIPPGHGKSTMLSYWVAWTMSMCPDSQFLYISYGHELAAKHTSIIKRIIELHEYRQLFGVAIRQDSRAKDAFTTNYGGSVKAFGSSGAIVGQDAGLPNCDRFSGAVILDDPHKIDEAHSETRRQGVISNYRETILQRPRAPTVPIIYIGQRVHEDDLAAYLLSGEDERPWREVILQAIDGAGNALYPEVNPLKDLLEKKEKNPYVFSSQFQQEPIPAGGALYKRKDFILLDDEPKFLCTFITADTAETDKNYNDATAFSFWGLYKLDETDELALHWIDCRELRVEPRDLEFEFKSFYSQCSLHKIKPTLAAIEKKSTGVTLLSVLQDMRGLEIREVKRTKASGSKTSRFLEMQPIIASKLVSLPRNGKHTEMCISHMEKITANNSHRWDDIADNIYDACKMALIDKTLWLSDNQDEADKVSRAVAQDFSNKLRILQQGRRQ